MKTAVANPPSVVRGVFDGEPGCNGCDDPINFDKNIDITLLENFLAPILVDVKELPVSLNQRREANFRHYTSPLDAEVSNTVGSVRDVESKDYFWVVQVASIYESFETKDNDYEKPFLNLNWKLGYSAFLGNDGPSVIYQEEVRDISNNSTVPVGTEFVTNFLATVTSHEILHRFFGLHAGTGQAKKVWEHGIMDGINALIQEPNELAIELSGVQRIWIQGRRSPR